MWQSINIRISAWIPMSFQQTLVEAGFSPEASSKLLDSEHFTARNRNKSAIGIAEHLFRIAEIYNVNSDTIRKAVLTHPPFAGYDHTRVINGIKDTYKYTDEQAAKAVLTHPPFAGYDHIRVINGIKEAYGCTDEQAAKAVLCFPPFAGYDHTRVINGIKEAYGCTDEQAAKAVLTHPRFAGLDHARVLRQQTKIGRLVGVEEDMIRNEILKRPPLAGYSAKRYLAVIDVFRQLDNALTDVPKEHMVDWWLKNFATSPYVPDMKRERVSHAIEKGNTGEPGLLKALRRSAPKLRVKAQ